MQQPGHYQPGQMLPGTVYRVVRHLATGGMGSVYDVEDTTVGKRYVLKTLHPNLVSREDLARRMRDEARSLAKLQHPNIVDVITAGVTGDGLRTPYYVMERLVGQNLRVVLEKKGTIDRPHAFRIAIDVADALEHAHEHNIVHRDVKPENIFLHRNTNGTTITKLLDFGIVRLLDRKASHTQGKFIGTLRYASPEQITGGPLGPASDVYSLGVVLFEMLSGRGPFDEAGDAYAIGAAHASSTAPLLSCFAAVPPEVERLVASTLSKDPADRPRDCFAFASELRRLLRLEVGAPRVSTLANPLSVAGPLTPVEVDERGPTGTPSTERGRTVPSPSSDRSAPSDPSAPAPPSTRVEGGGAVSPIAATVAVPEAPPPHSPGATVAEGEAPRAASGEHAAAARPSFGSSPLHAEATEAIHPSNPSNASYPSNPGSGPGVDRDAPTRMSSPLAEQQQASNDTEMVDSSRAREQAVQAAFGEREPLAVPTPGGGHISGDIVFPPMQSHITTGPTAGEARARPPEKGSFFLVGVASALAATLVGGALVAVKQSGPAAGSASVASGALAADAPSGQGSEAREQEAPSAREARDESAGTVGEALAAARAGEEGAGAASAELADPSAAVPSVAPSTDRSAVSAAAPTTAPLGARDAPAAHSADETGTARGRARAPSPPGPGAQARAAPPAAPEKPPARSASEGRQLPPATGPGSPGYVPPVRFDP